MSSTCGISDEDAEAIGSALADEATPGVIDAVAEIEQTMLDVAGAALDVVETVGKCIDPS